MKIKDSLRALKNKDLTSVILFVLYKLRDDDKYSTISELAYVLDEKNLYNLLEYFGGLTITIPTIDELEAIIIAFNIYQTVNIEGHPYDQTINILYQRGVKNIVRAKEIYLDVCDILSDISLEGILNTDE